MEKMRLVKGAVEIVRTLGYVVSAGGKFEQGREGEGVRDLGRAAVNVLQKWDVVSYPVKLLWDTVQPPPFSDVSALAASVEARRGFFTGKWDSQPGRIELIYHDLYTDAISLFFQKVGSNVFQLSDGSGYNVYKGVIEHESGLLVLTGFNSQRQEMIIVGEPVNEGHRIEFECWRRTGSNQITRVDSFVLVRHRNQE